ncbi:MAG: hypothetical protein KAV43_04090 [Hadesarchaea archaeon]|nr:hypothetical protein [Hadesarchaea archaeon]
MKTEEEEFTHYKVTDPDLINSILKGRSGISAGIKIKKAICSICGKNYLSCPHITGNKYGNKTAVAIVKDFEFTEISLVETPTIPACRVTEVLVPKSWFREKLLEDPRFKRVKIEDERKASPL